MQTAGKNKTGSDRGILSGEKTAGPLTRDEVLRLSSEMIRKLHTRVNGTRFKVQSSDSAKLAHVRALVQTLQVYGTILKDHELTELEERITELEKLKEKRLRENDDC